MRKLKFPVQIDDDDHLPCWMMGDGELYFSLYWAEAGQKELEKERSES